jgi:arabinosyltransferase B
MRLCDLVAGSVCWLLLSHEVLPRLGPAVTSSKAADRAAGMVLLAARIAFNNGLRPEPIIASMCASRLTSAGLW